MPPSAAPVANEAAGRWRRCSPRECSRARGRIRIGSTEPVRGLHARQTVPSCTGRGVHVCSTSRLPQPHGALPPLQEIRSVHPYTLLAVPAMKQKARQAFNALDMRWDRAKSKSAASVLGPLAVCPPDSLPVRSPSRRGTPPHPKPSLIMHVCANTTLGIYSYRS